MQFQQPSSCRPTLFNSCHHLAPHLRLRFHIPTELAGGISFLRGWLFPRFIHLTLRCPLVVVWPIKSAASRDQLFVVSAHFLKREENLLRSFAELTVASLRSAFRCYLRFTSTKIIDSSSTRGIKFQVCCFCKGALERESAVTSRPLRFFVLFTESRRKTAQSPTLFNRSHNFTSSNRFVCKTYCVVGTIDLTNASLNILNVLLMQA